MHFKNWNVETNFATFINYVFFIYIAQNDHNIIFIIIWLNLIIFFIIWLKSTQYFQNIALICNARISLKKKSQMGKLGGRLLLTVFIIKSFLFSQWFLSSCKPHFKHSYPKHLSTNQKEETLVFCSKFLNWNFVKYINILFIVLLRTKFRNF